MHKELTGYLNTLDSGECYRVESVLKESDNEITERVYLIGANGLEQGPFVRKRFTSRSKMGNAYSRIYELQADGKRFLHIPRIFDYEKTDDSTSFVMEWADGDSVLNLVQKEGPSFDLALSVVPPLCDAIIELHEGFDPPLIHRDLTPSNVIVSPAGLSLIDFGIARTYDEEADQDTECFGTRGYAPPEQFGYGQTSIRSDVYALGMILRYCLTGEAPSGPVGTEESAREGAYPALFDVIKKATAFDPQMRFANAREFKSAFLSAIQPSYPDAQDRNSQERELATSSPAPNERKSLFSRIPRWLGSIWNVFVILIWLILVMGAIGATFMPSEVIQNYPLGTRASIYFGCFIIVPGLLCYLLLDKRGLRKHVHAISSLTWRKEVPYCMTAIVIVIAVSCLLAGIFGALG